MQVVILAAGEGTRMRPLTSSRSKVMLPVAGRPLLDYLVRGLIAGGVNDVVIVVGYQGLQVKAFFDANPPPDVHPKFVSDEHHNRGNAISLQHAEPHTADSFLLVNGDNLLSEEDVRGLTSWRGEIVLGGYHIDQARQRKVPLNLSEYGFLVVEDGRVTAIVEKPEDPPSEWIFTGACFFPDRSIFQAIRETPEHRATREINIPDAINTLLSVKGPGRLQKVVRWEDVGRPWFLLETNEIEMTKPNWLGAGVHLSKPAPYATLENLERIYIGGGTTIRNGAYIIGPTFIGPDCDIGPNCYIRPCTVLLGRNHVGNGAEVKNSIILEGTDIPHPTYVGDSVIGAECNLGGGTMVGNLRLRPGTVQVVTPDGKLVDTGLRKLGVVMGDHVKVGMNVSFDPGTIIGEKSLIGAGKFIRGTFPANSTVW